MDTLEQTENGETALQIMKLALELENINGIYKNIPLKDRINIAIEILKLYETRAIRINLIEIADSVSNIGYLLEKKLDENERNN
jgi:hypothetical protein